MARRQLDELLSRLEALRRPVTGWDAYRDDVAERFNQGLDAAIRTVQRLREERAQ